MSNKYYIQWDTADIMDAVLHAVPLNKPYNHHKVRK